MSSNDVAKGKKFRIIKLVLLLVIFSLMAFVIVSVIIGFTTGSSWLFNLFTPPAPEISVDEFSFDIGRLRTFASANNSVAAAGTLGIKVLDQDGRESFRDSFRMNQPAIAGSNNRYIAFDIGGTAARVFNNSQVTSSIEANGAIVSASINQNGWFCIVTQEGGGFRGVVTVYNSSGSVVYRVRKGSGFILSAHLSHDNKSLAVLNLTENGSRITFYNDINVEEEPSQLFDYGGLILEITYLTNGDILAISMKSLFLVDSSGTGEMLYSFADKRLGGYTYDNDLIALRLYYYGVGHQGQLITFLPDGTILGDIEFDREIISMSTADSMLVILKNDGVTFYDHELEALSASVDGLSAAGANRVLAINANVAVATSDNSAIVIRVNNE